MIRAELESIIYEVYQSMNKFAARGGNLALTFDFMDKIQPLCLVARQPFSDGQKNVVIDINALSDAIKITMINVCQKDEISHQRFKPVNTGEGSTNKLNLLFRIFKFLVDY